VSRARVALHCVAGAVLLTLSYPPFRFPFLPFVAVIPAVLLIRAAERAGDPRAAFRWGFWYGFAVNGVALYWLVVALWHFTRLSALGYLATIAIFGLWSGGLFWLAVRTRLRFPRLPLALLFPILWTAMDWVIGHQGDIRFPWLGLGTALADAPPLIQWADIAGARGVTFWVAWCNVALLEAALADPATWARRLRRAAPVAASVVVALGYGIWRMRTLPTREVGVVGMVQPNIAFDEKWGWGEGDSEVAKQLSLSRRVRALSRPDLVLWPEAAVPGYLAEQPAWDSSLARFSRESHTPLLVGALHRTVSGTDREYYNAAFFYDSTGAWRPHPVYEKHYLVPVVERVPFVNPRWFAGLEFFGGFGRGTGLPVYATGIGRFGVIICYESIFEDLPRAYRRAGAQFLVNITNDAWYGRTTAPYQHASHLVLRAIETRMGIARAANSGISELVDPTGRVHDATGVMTEAVDAGRLVTSDVIPLYVRLGDWVGVLSALGALAMLGGLAVPRR